MERIEFSIDVDATVARVLSAYWELEDWPSIAKHVRAIDMHYEDERVQVLTMHVQTRARLDRFQSVRICQGQAIFYFQPTPPPALAQHYGWWRVSEVPGEPEMTRVTSEHFLDIRLPEATRFLADAGILALNEDAEGDEAHAEIVRRHARQDGRDHDQFRDQRGLSRWIRGGAL